MPPTTTSKSDPLPMPRVAGQGLDDDIRETYEWPMAMLVGFSMGLICAAIAVLVNWFLWRSAVPWMVSAMALITAAGTFVWWRVREPGVFNKVKGLRGEREVGAVLQDLGRLGYVAKHDIQCERDGRKWNIDHLLIGPSGVYVIETKWKAKARQGSGIAFDGDRVHFDDGTWDDEVIAQVRRNVRDIRVKLDGAGLGDVPVRGVVCFPGSGMVTGSSGQDIWVLKPEALETWIKVEERNGTRVAEQRLRTVMAVLAS